MPLSSLLSMVILHAMNQDTRLCSPFRLQPAQKTQAGHPILPCLASPFLSTLLESRVGELDPISRAM